jgi:nitrite reductase/ring-hydroxylating ferredoxin subunit
MLRFIACKTTELPQGAMIRFEPPERGGIVVYNLDGDLFASDDACTH